MDIDQYLDGSLFSTKTPKISRNFYPFITNNSPDPTFPEDFSKNSKIQRTSELDYVARERLRLYNHIQEIRKLNKNISLKILSYFNIEEDIINQCTPEFIFVELIYIIKKGLKYINNNLPFLNTKIKKINTFILKLKNLNTIFKNIYLNMRKYKKRKENTYLSKISSEGMSFYDFQEVEYIKYSKINISKYERNDLIQEIEELQKIIETEFNSADA
jgi:hypothetical protein